MPEIIRKLATIERIAGIFPIPNAEQIERAMIRGWNVVIKKGQFKEGDLCIYCEIDSLLPNRPEFEFLRPYGFRIKTVRFRGQISQGIIFPLEILNIAGYLQSICGDHRWDTLLILTNRLNNGDSAIPILEGEDVTEALGIIKYEPPIPAELNGIVKGGFPSHSIKTDEERIQNLIEKYDEYKKEEWIATEKLDGTSYTAVIYNDKFSVCGRTLEYLENETNTYWKVARECEIEKKMRKYMADHNLKALTLQGELIGEGIQKNKYKLRGQQVRWFRAFDPIKFEYFPFEEFWDMIIEMGLTAVPMVDRFFHLPDNYEDLILYADGQSMLAPVPREGVVFVSKTSTLNNGRLSFKVISNKFILKHDE